MKRKQPEFYRYSDKPCVTCEKLFTPKSSVHKFCSDTCKGKHKYLVGKVTTDSQYKTISGNWYKYLQRLSKSRGRKLEIYELLELLERQDYKCALSGVPMTCTLGKGMTFMTNASIDRISPGGEYAMDNIRLVCRIANVMKWNMTDEELKVWCERILAHG